MCLEQESIRVKPGVPLGVMREVPCAQWSPDTGDKAVKTVLGTMMKALLEESQLYRSLSLQGWTLCLNLD